MDQEIKNLIDAIVDENSVESEKIFADIMASKLSDRIDTYRQEVADSYFNPVAEVEDEEVEEEQVAEE